MNKYKVCVYAICKNEEKFVSRWMDSMSEADMVIVTDTGSEDKTIKALRKRGAIVYEDSIKPWRFDTARNISLSHVPEDADICVCTDLDELFEPGWRKHLEEKWTPQTKLAKYIYNWSLKADGSPDIRIYYTKIHARHNFEWRHRVHEWLTYTGSEPQITTLIDEIVLNHYPDPAKSRNSYLTLLEEAVQEEPENDRYMYYLGREYMYKAQYEKCIETLKRHLALPLAFWADERSASMRWIAFSYYRLGDKQEAFRWYLKAIAEVPKMRDAYIECAKMGYLTGDWAMVYFMTEEALKIKERSKTYTNMGYSWDETPYDLGSIACYRLGLLNKAEEFALEAIRVNPNDERLRKNLELIRNALNRRNP